MSINIKKKTIKIIVAIIIAIIVIIGAFFIIKNVLNSVNTKSAEEKLGSINAEELQEKLIEALEQNDKLIIETSEITTTIGKKEDISNGSFELHLSMDNPSDDYKDFVFAFYESMNYEGLYIVAVPLFRIVSDENNNFSRIEYNQSFRSIVSNTIIEVFNSQYDLDIKSEFNFGQRRENYADYNNYDITTYDIESYDDDFHVSVMKEYNNNYGYSSRTASELLNNDEYTKVMISIFGLDIE